MKRKYILLYVLIGIILVVSFVCIVWEYVHIEESPVIYIGTKNMSHYYNDRLVVLGKDASKPFLLEIDMGRMQKEDGQYAHQYITNLLYDGKVYDELDVFKSYEDDVQSSSAITSYERSAVHDLSARELIDFQVRLKTITLHVHTQELVSDFLVKNTPAYTKYYSEGDATVEIGEEMIEAYVLYGKSYSDDYKQFIYYDGFHDTRLLARQFVFWDESGGVYLIDRSDVENETPAYRSHQWVLHKNDIGQALKKFSVEIESKEKDSWIFSVPELIEKGSHLEMNEEFKGLVKFRRISGYAQGEIVRIDGSRSRVWGVAHETR